MILMFLAAVAGQSTEPPRAGDPYRAAPATIVAEPIALFIAGADRTSADGRTTLDELRKAVLEATSADPPWQERGDTGIGYIQYSDWTERWLGDRNALPTPFEIDRNGDNRITYAEFLDRMEAIFSRFDGNKDGVVTRKELLTICNTPTGERRRRDRDSDQPTTPPRR